MNWAYARVPIKFVFSVNVPTRRKRLCRSLYVQQTRFEFVWISQLQHKSIAQRITNDNKKKIIYFWRTLKFHYAQCASYFSRTIFQGRVPIRFNDPLLLQEVKKKESFYNVSPLCILDEFIYTYIIYTVNLCEKLNNYNMCCVYDMVNKNLKKSAFIAEGLYCRATCSRILYIISTMRYYNIRSGPVDTDSLFSLAFK